MPFFMLISGYLFYFSFEKREMKPLIVYKTQGLIHAILGGSVFVYLTTTCVFGVLSGNYAVCINGGWLNTLPSLWFLWSILSSMLVVAFICKTIDRLWLQILLLFLGWFVVLLFPCGIENAFMFPYYVLGFFFAKYKDRISQNVMRFKYVAIIAYIFLMFFFERKHYIYTTGLWNGQNSAWDTILIDAFRWAVGLFGSISVFIIFELVYKLLVCKTSRSGVWKWCSNVGSKSLQIYVISVTFLSSYLPRGYNVIRNIFPNIDAFFVAHTWIYNFIFALLISVLYLVVLYFVVKVFEKMKIARIIFGR